MKALTSRVLYKASPLMLAVALGLLGPGALNDDEDDARADVQPGGHHDGGDVAGAGTSDDAE